MHKSMEEVDMATATTIEVRSVPYALYEQAVRERNELEVRTRVLERQLGTRADLTMLEEELEQLRDDLLAAWTNAGAAYRERDTAQAEATGLYAYKERYEDLKLALAELRRSLTAAEAGRDGAERRLRSTAAHVAALEAEKALLGAQIAGLKDENGWLKKVIQQLQARLERWRENKMRRDTDVRRQLRILREESREPWVRIVRVFRGRGRRRR